MRAAGILIEHEKVALIKREREGSVYYLFPGGQVEENETPEEAVKRELLEELGLHVDIQRLLAIVVFKERKQFYFLVNRVSGTFGTGSGEELNSSKESEAGAYLLQWMSIHDLSKHQVRPHSVVNLLIDATKGGWSRDVTTLEETN
jgi:8-oxo-dGTP diphosphatase